MSKWKMISYPIFSGILTALLYVIFSTILEKEVEWWTMVGLFIGGIIGYYLFFIKEIFFTKSNEKK